MARKAAPEGLTERRAQMAQRLRMVREVLEANQAEVARNVGVSSVAWNRYEKGARDIDPGALASFCRFYGVSADWVLLGELLSLSKPILAALVAANPDVQRQLDANQATSENSAAPLVPPLGRGRTRA